MKKKEGKLVIVEGCDGAGKTSVLNFLETELSGNENIVFTREPGGTEIGVDIRKILMNKSGKKITPLTELYLFCADRAQHTGEIIIPALEFGKHVISDRFDISTIAYQIYARGIESIDLFKQINTPAKRGIEADAVIFLDVKAHIGLERRNKSKEGKTTRFDEEAISFHEKVRQGYLACRDNCNVDSPLSPIWHTVDTNDMTEQEVKQDVLNLVKKILTD